MEETSGEAYGGIKGKAERRKEMHSIKHAKTERRNKEEREEKKAKEGFSNKFLVCAERLREVLLFSVSLSLCSCFSLGSATLFSLLNTCTAALNRGRCSAVVELAGVSQCGRAFQHSLETYLGRCRRHEQVQLSHKGAGPRQAAARLPRR